MRTFSIAILIATFLAYAGCAKREESPGGAGEKQISFFTMQLRPTFDDYFHELFQEFENTHPGVKINWLDYPAQNYDTKLITSFMGSSPPDVINLTPQSLPKFVNRQTLVPLDDLLPQDIFDSYFQNVIKDACMMDGKTYALPWYLATAMTMCNMTIFRQAGLRVEDIPSTFEEMRDIAVTIRDKTDKFAFFPIYTESGTLRGLLIDAGVPILNDSETKALFNTPKAVEVFGFWADFYKDGLAPKEALTALHRRPIELYKSGRLAIFHTGPQFLKHVKADAPDVYQNTYVSPRLHWEGYEIYPIDVHNIVISAKSKHPKLAAEFAAFVTNGPNQLKFCKLTTIIPSVVEATKDPYFTDVDDTPEGKARKISVEQIEKGIVIPNPTKHPGKLSRVLDDVTEEVCLGNMTPGEGLEEAEEKWNEILKD